VLDVFHRLAAPMSFMAVSELPPNLKKLSPVQTDAGSSPSINSRRPCSSTSMSVASVAAVACRGFLASVLDCLAQAVVVELAGACPGHGRDRPEELRDYVCRQETCEMGF
jgi:hypothetical protein